MTPEQLAELYPRLFHMANVGSWPAIQSEGLLSTRQLVDACNPAEAVRDAILRRRRPRSITLTHPRQGPVVVRDQGPLREDNLHACLSGMTVQEWLDMLNDRVFFWLHPDKLSTLLRARLYRNHEHDVLTVDTRSLLATHATNIRLSPMNSGATIFPNASQRGPDTFLRIEDYPYQERRRQRSTKDAVVELAVLDGVPDIVDHVLRVERRRGVDVLAVLHNRD
ncbi:MAG: hypothetical protein M3Y48_03745 [Actinomycetota bacterium]|nr:hypothetical protein [Actinomycetota bacterium]